MADESIQDVTVDVSTLTLGELSAIEIASGLSFERILRARMTFRLALLYVHELRSSERPRSWQELSSLRLSDVSPSTSPSASAGPSETSNG